MSDTNQQIPMVYFGLHAAFIGSSTVLNNGQTPNTLHIGLTNNNLFPSADSKDVDIVLNTDTLLNIWFVIDDKQAGSNQADRNWGLTTYDHFAEIDHHIILPDGTDDTVNWNINEHKPPAGNTLLKSLDGWQISRKEGQAPVTLKPGECLRFQLSKIKTDLPDGPSIAYYQFQMASLPKANTPSSTFGPVLKTPSVIRGEKVGIGTNDPGVSMDVIGGIRARGGAPGAYGANNNGYFFNAPGDNDSGMSSSKDGQVEFYVNSREAMRIVDSTGTKIGIAVLDPQAPIHIGNPTKSNQISLRLDGYTSAEFGGGIKKGIHNGEIGYQKYSQGLDIVGAGDTANDRQITLWANGGQVSLQGKLVVEGDQEIKGQTSLHDGNGNAVIYYDPNHNGSKAFFLRSGSNSNYKEILNVGENYLRLANGAHPIIYKSFTAANHYLTPTNISSKDYIAIIAGWKGSGYDLNENGSHDWAIEMFDFKGSWYISIEMANDHSNTGTWSVNVMAFHKSLMR
ncbi:MAG: hypothetical protein DWQ02_10955 [Bacteroidetes bacterium]|nr:MAG: hypothetical protein DWQ02_10955 [Bacteroidota bacterium]